MNTMTLRGIFPEPKPVHRKNFLKENVRNIKEIQMSATHLNKTPSTLQKGRVANKFSLTRPTSLNVPKKQMPLAKNQSKSSNKSKLVDIGVQTEFLEDMAKFYNRTINDTVKNTRTKSKIEPLNHLKKDKNQAPDKIGDISSFSQEQTDALKDTLKKLNLKESAANNNKSKIDHVKENMKQVLKTKIDTVATDPNLAPSTYKKGALPKYLQKEREDEEQARSLNRDSNVLIPDDEKREYLRVARENYAGLIRELNSMPVRNDTLRCLRRKVQIEDELKRLDDVIKIFQKDKVVVKACP